MKKLFICGCLLIALVAIGVIAQSIGGTSGGGGVSGPGSSTNNDIPTFNGTGGSTLQDPGGCTLTSSVFNCPSALTIGWNGDTKMARSAAGIIQMLNSSAQELDVGSSSTNHVKLLQNFNGAGAGVFGVEGTTPSGNTAMHIDAHGASGSSVIIEVNEGIQCFLAGATNIWSCPTITGTTAVNGATFQTASNCAQNSVSPSACGSAASGVIVVPTLTTTYTVNTSAVTANSRIFLQVTSDNTGIPSSPTCAALAVSAVTMPSSRVAGTSFTFSLPSTTGTTCFNYWIVN